MTGDRLSRLTYLDIGMICTIDADGYADQDDVVCYFECESDGDEIGSTLAVAPELLTFVSRVANCDPVFAKGIEKQRIAEARALVAKATGKGWDR